MLLNDLTITEVAYGIGLESLSYFNKIFKKHTGETPSNFKKRNLPTHKSV
jgi:AraC-like DNA-binding protein